MSYEDNHILFEIKPVENRTKTLAAGHPVYDDVEFCTITPPGGNLVVHKQVDEQVRKDYEKRYKAWLDDREEPIEGTPIQMWPGVSPGMAQTLKAMHVHTVETLSRASDNILEQIGPGARALQEKAKAWLKGSEDIGKLAEQVAALTTQNEDLVERNKQLEAALARVRDKLEEPAPGRQPKVVDELKELVA